MNFFLIILSTFFFVLCLPPFSLWYFAPLLLLPVLIVIDKCKNYKSYFLYGFLYGFSLYFFVFAWVPKSCSSLLEISIFWGWAIGMLTFALIGVIYGVCFCIIGSVWQKNSWIIIFLWPGFERLLLFGLPFTIGYGWVNSIGGIQVADLMGVYFLSLLSTFYSYILFYGYKHKNHRLKAWYAFGVAIILHFGYGAYKTTVFSLQKSINKQQVVLVKTGIDPKIKRDDPQKTYQKVMILLDQASNMATENAVIVLPESIFVQAFKENDVRISDLYKHLKPKQTLIFGFNVKSENKYYNSIGMLIKKEELASIQEKEQIVKADDLAVVYYSKNNLLLIGEYLPFENVLFRISPKLKEITESSRFYPGTKSVTFENNNLKIFPFICIESMYGGWVADNCRRQSDSNVLLNISEDGWFQSAHGSELHSVVLYFRAVEMRKPLVRCVNVGVCLALNQWGANILKSDVPTNLTINDEKIYLVDVPIVTGNSFYVNYGFVFEYLIEIIAILYIVWFVLAKLKLLRKTARSVN